MSWLERPEQKTKNPVTKWLQWKSEEKTFSYYDKEKEENVNVDLPLNFVILEHYHTVKGWDDQTESGIYANEVFSIGTEELNVKSFGNKNLGKKARDIAKGVYKKIKPTILSSGGHYARSIYALTSELEIINISLKGSGVQAYSEFVNDVLGGDYNFDKNWVKITGAKDHTKGRVNYSTPIFEKGSEIKDSSKIAPFAKQLQDYMLSYMSDEEPKRQVSEVDKYLDSKSKTDEKEDDLPF